MCQYDIQSYFANLNQINSFVKLKPYITDTYHTCVYYVQEYRYSSQYIDLSNDSIKYAVKYTVPFSYDTHTAYGMPYGIVYDTVSI